MKKLLVGAVAAAMVLAGCSSPAASGDTIRIGANFELSGAVSSYGSAELEGVKLAVKEINAAGGVLGKQIELVEMDNKSDQAEVTSVATRLATQEGVVAIVGPATSGNAKAAISVANQTGVPIVTPSATADDVTSDAAGNVQPFAFRNCFQDSFQGQVMAKFASENLNAKTAAIIADNSSDYGKGLAKEFAAAFPGTVVVEESFSDTDKDFSAIITKLKNQEFDVLFIPGYYGQAGLIIKQARAAGITAPIIGGDGFDSPELVNLAGTEALNDVYFSAHFSTLNEDSKVTDFIAAFEAEYNKKPNAFNALAYDSVYMIKDAIERAGTVDVAAVNEALAQTSGFHAVTGVISIDSNHNAVKSATVIKLENGKEVSATTVDVD